jgi:hypothetical protein
VFQSYSGLVLVYYLLQEIYLMQRFLFGTIVALKRYCYDTNAVVSNLYPRILLQNHRVWDFQGYSGLVLPLLTKKMHPHLMQRYLLGAIVALNRYCHATNAI